jgi:hypothetical protein
MICFRGRHQEPIYEYNGGPVPSTDLNRSEFAEMYEAEDLKLKE